MTTKKLSLQKRQHRERHQPNSRKKLGLLEKHKDYVKRARDYHSKQDRIKTLERKASERNKDEFYWGMIKGRTKKGIHKQDRADASLDTDLVKILKSQDKGYVRVQRALEEKRVHRLQTQLSQLVSLSSSSSKDPLHQTILSLMPSSFQNGSPSGKPGERSVGSSNGDKGTKRKHTVFLENEDAVEDYGLTSSRSSKGKTQSKQLPSPSSSSPVSSSPSSKSKLNSHTLEKEQEIRDHLLSLTTSLSSRLSRLSALDRALREMETQQNLMGRGSKTLLSKKQQSKSANNNGGVGGGSDPFWDEDGERADGKVEVGLGVGGKHGRGKGSVVVDKPEEGITTGARVWKWKFERRK